MRRARPALVIGLAALWACGSPQGPATELAERPAIYKWVDENGIAHYTTDRDRIPKALRNRVPRRDPAHVEIPPTLAPAGVESPPTLAPPGVESPPTLAPPGVESPPTLAPPGEGGDWTARDRVREGGDWTARDRVREETAVAERTPPAPGAGEPSRRSAEPPGQDLDMRIAALEADIATNEEILKARLSEPGDGTVANDPETRAIAERLPRLIAALRALRDERGKSGER